MSYEPDELESAEVRGWEQGRRQGEADGLTKAAIMVERAAAEKFIGGDDREAGRLRSLANAIRGETPAREEQK